MKLGEVGAYVRVSSASQTAAMQIDAIQRAASSRGDTIRPFETYLDKLSGKSMARPNLERVRAAVRAGEIRRLYVYRLDRLTRSGFRDMFQLIDEFRNAGCELITIADGFDLSVPGPATEVILFMLAWAAKFEREAMGERISAARLRVEAAGGSWGRPRRMGEAELRTMRKMAEEGRSHREIAMALKTPKATITRALGRKPPQKKWLPGALKRKSKRGAVR